MKYLQEYIEQAQTKALDDNGAFFAFNTKQFDESKKPNIKYLNMGSGLICPKDNADTLNNQLTNIVKLGIAQDIKENGIVAIIKRELANHEAYYSGDTYSTSDALQGYGITDKQISAIFNQEYSKQNI